MQIKLTKKFSYLLLCITIVTFFSSLAFAAGGGGGGSGGGSSCSADIWTCSEWTPCDRYENTQKRSCELTFNCQSADDPRPEEFASCTYVSEVLKDLKCGEFSQMRDRVACRLGLSEEELAKELKLHYLPEECRPIANIDEKEECVKTYAKLQVCWQFPVGEQRIGCVKEIIGLKSLATARNSCVEKEGAYKALCLQEVNKKIYWTIKFRFYDLEERAEELMGQGVSKSLVIDFVTALEEKKLQFNEANTKEKKRKIIIEVRELWKEFVKKVREDLKSKQQ